MCTRTLWRYDRTIIEYDIWLYIYIMYPAFCELMERFARGKVGAPFIKGVRRQQLLRGEAIHFNGHWFVRTLVFVVLVIHEPVHTLK